MGGGRVSVVYVDSVFILNMLMDYLILIATAKLSGVAVHRLRCFGSAVMGGAYAVAVFLPGCGFLSGWLCKIMFGVVISAVAFWGTKHFLRLTLLFFGVSCGMAGSVLAIGLLSGGVPMENGIFYTDIDARVLLIAAGAAYLILTIVFRAGARHHIRGTLLPAVVSCGGRQTALTVLCDTGNALQDPATGRSVLVASAARLFELWPGNLQPVLTGKNLRDPAGTMERLNIIDARIRFYLIPYSSVGVSGGLLLAFRSDWTRIGKRTYRHLLVALSPTEVGETYGALWGDTGRNEEYEKNSKMDVPSAAETGTDFGIADSLHRGKRYAAAASIPGKRGGSTEGHWKSGSAKDPDRT